MKTRLGISRCCCDESCVAYLPCCIRDIRIQCRIDVARGGTDSYVYAKTFTLTNHCNDQESPDWSTWERVGADTNGDTQGLNWTVSGISNQGCTFSIDILHHHLLCSCGTKNFTASLTLVNPESDDGGNQQPGTGDASVTVDNISMSVTFDDGTSPCVVPLKSATSVSNTLGAGELWTINMEFGNVDWTTCFPNCLDLRSVVLEDENYLSDLFDNTCIRPVGCVGGNQDYIDIGPYTKPRLGSCSDVLCPPCGCILDHDKLNPDPFFVSYSVDDGAGIVDPGLPIGVEHNDILLLHIAGKGEDTIEDVPPVVPAAPAPAGYQYWTPVDDLTGSVASGTDGAATRTRQTLYWMRYNENTPPATEVPDAGEYTLAVITAWRNCKVADYPLNEFQSNVDATADTAMAITGGTTTVNNCLVVLSHTAGDNVTVSGWTNASLSGLAEVVDESTTVGTGGHVGVAWGLDLNAGVVSATTATVSEAEEEANWMVAIEPAESRWSTSGCKCQCMNEESRRACKFPKELIVNATADGGEVTFCVDASDDADEWVITFIDSTNRRVGGIYKGINLGYSGWRYFRTGEADTGGSGSGVWVTEEHGTVFPVCNDFIIEWQRELDDSLTLTVNGVTRNVPVIALPNFQYDDGSAAAYITAQRGSHFATIAI